MTDKVIKCIITGRYVKFIGTRFNFEIERVSDIKKASKLSETNASQFYGVSRGVDYEIVEVES